ncbi:hypothetical protein ACFFNY_20810 [Paenibacillus hodogayensis]|uniref:Magnesium transporter MgtE intracellular domain-containing protein n=1 Tax=Paenibacillus hodogayensis TaxID=279208 RepID=A0ABV5W0D9_9BACL
MKLFRWLGNVILVGIVAASISAATTYYVLNVYVREMLKPYEAVLPLPEMGISDFIGKLWTYSNPSNTRSTATAGTSIGSAPEPAKPTAAQQEDEAVAAWSQSGREAAREKDKIVISTQQFQEKREKLSGQDKSDVFTMLSTRLPEDALQRISTMLESGLTAGDLQEIEKIVQQYLKPEEYTKLMEIVNKY